MKGVVGVIVVVVVEDADEASIGAADEEVDESMEIPGLSRRRSTSDEVEEVDGETGPWW